MSGIRESANGGGKDPRRRRRAVDRRRRRDRAPLRGLRRRGGRRTAASALAAVTRVRARPDRARLDAPRHRRASRSGGACASRASRRAILFLTAKDAIENKVEALRAGGDDYVTKPFSLAEIVARVQAILRRTGGDLPGDVLRFADLVARRGAATRSSAATTPIELTATEFALLRFFMLNPRRVLSKGADPPERLALRLRRQLERRRDVRQLPAPEARRRSARR